MRLAGISIQKLYNQIDIYFKSGGSFRKCGQSERFEQHFPARQIDNVMIQTQSRVTQFLYQKMNSYAIPNYFNSHTCTFHVFSF